MRDPSLVDAQVGAGQRALLAMRIDEAVVAFEAALAHDPHSVPAHFGLYEALQVKGERERAIAHQRRALEQQRFFIEKAAAPGAPTMLLLTVPGDWQANVPLEFMYGQMSIGVRRLFVDETPLDPRALPQCDVLFNAVAHSPAAEPTLRALESWFGRVEVPRINEPARVAALSRDGVARDYADLEGALVPLTRRLARGELRADRLPVTIRPIDSQAGSALDLLERPDDLERYLQTTSAAEFFVAPFVDYRAADGYFRKYRIIFVEGVPYAHHLAISDRWMVHYYNACNEREAWIRDEEARFLAGVESVFDGPRRAVLDEIARRAGLEYFGIDCSVLPDGRVLIFEIDVAMIVHLGDPIERYPYKHRYIPRIYDAFEEMIYKRAGRELSLKA